MVFASFGVKIEEGELRALCDCTMSGTGALMAVDVSRQLSFPETAKHTLTLTELQTVLFENHNPIVFVDLRPLEGLRGIHAMIVVGITQEEIIVLDPLKGERTLPLQSFNTAWAMRHNLAIIVKR